MHFFILFVKIKQKELYMEKILIAIVLKPQGLSGEIKCKLENNNYEIIKNITEVYLNDKEIPTRILKKSFRAGYLYLQFNTINSREKADLLRNTKIYAKREQLYLPDDEYMITDLLGFNLIDQGGNNIGKLLDIQNFGATDIMIVEQYSREYMVPFVKDIVLDVNTSSGIIVVNKNKYDEAKICD